MVQVEQVLEQVKDLVELEVGEASPPPLEVEEEVALLFPLCDAAR